MKNRTTKNVNVKQTPWGNIIVTNDFKEVGNFPNVADAKEFAVELAKATGKAKVVIKTDFYTETVKVA